MVEFPVIDPVATGENILRLRQARGLTVRDLQRFFGFEEPQAIYKWQKGKSLPSVDNLCALGALLGVSMEDILVLRKPRLKVIDKGQQTQVCCPFSLSINFWLSSAYRFPRGCCRAQRILINMIAGGNHTAIH